MDNTNESARRNRGPARSVLQPLLSGQTYRNLLYLLVAFPLGLAYGLFVGFGFVFGLVFLIVGIGIGILLATVGGVRLLSAFERWLANRLLRVDLRSYDDRSPSEGTLATIESYVEAPSTWRGVGFVSIKLWVGVVGLLLLFFLWNAIELITAPLRYPTAVEFGELNDRPIQWTIETLPEAAVAVPVGLLLGAVLLYVSNGFAYVAERIAIAMLGRPAETRSEERFGGSRIDRDDRTDRDLQGDRGVRDGQDDRGDHTS